MSAVSARGIEVSLSPASSLERLYVAHRGAVVRYLVSVCDSHEDAVDLAAVVFERAFTVIARDPTIELGLPWLIRTARNAAVDHSRRRRVRQIAVRRLDGGDTIADGPERGFLERERAGAIRTALRTLPDATRDALVLRYALGMPAREIATVLGKREDATQKLITRGLARLREMLDADI